MNTKNKELNKPNFLQKYFFIILPVVYGILYLTTFFYLEKKNTSNFHLVHMKIDDYIPFCEYFVIPYYLWFFYIAATVGLFMFLDRKDYYRMCIMLGTGMTVFLIVSYIIPNGHDLRPASFKRNNIFTSLVMAMYQTDTPTNLFPSIHCYNSLVAHIAIAKNETLKNKKWLQTGSLVLCVSIILSTLFIKQHSMFDVLTAFAMTIIMYILVYSRFRIIHFLDK